MELMAQIALGYTIFWIVVIATIAALSYRDVRRGDKLRQAGSRNARRS